ncbi:unnamed protein product [Leuciscus chuanchicus]
MGEISALTDTEVNNVAIANLREVLRQLQVQRVRRTPLPGRPSQNIPPETIDTYLMRGIKAAEIARLFAVLEMTICRRMREYGIRVSDLYTDISNDDLDRSVAEIQNLYPNSGYRMMHGHLSSRGVKVQGLTAASLNDGPITPHDEPPDTSESASSTPSGQESWRQPRRRRSSLQMNIFKEQARQDQAFLSSITEVLNRAVQSFERATEAAERHARALEALFEAQHPFARQQAPYLLQHPPTYQ